MYWCKERRMCPSMVCSVSLKVFCTDLFPLPGVCDASGLIQKKTQEAEQLSNMAVLVSLRKDGPLPPTQFAKQIHQPEGFPTGAVEHTGQLTDFDFDNSVDFDLPSSISLMPEFLQKQPYNFPPNRLVAYKMLSDIIRVHPEWKGNIAKMVFNFQIEHAVVLPHKGGSGIYTGYNLSQRSIDGSGIAYTARLTGCYEAVNFCNAGRSGVIIEYNLANLIALRESAAVPSAVLESIVYVPPLAYDLYRGGSEDKTPAESKEPSKESLSSKEKRLGAARDPSTVFTTWHQSTIQNPEWKRRRELLSRLTAANVSWQNWDRGGYSDGTMEMRKLLRSTAILLNLHQTNWHHTAEEFRILPAILCGVVVISEVVPYWEQLPWTKYVVWTTNEQFVDTVKRVQSNYTEIFNAFFGSKSNLPQTLRAMWRNSTSQLEHVLRTSIERY